MCPSRITFNEKQSDIAGKLLCLAESQPLGCEDVIEVYWADKLKWLVYRRRIFVRNALQLGGNEEPFHQEFEIRFCEEE